MQVVDVQFYIAQLRPLDTRAQDYGFDGYMRAWWHDPRLAYNGTADGGAFDNLNLGAYEKANIWKPEFYWEGARTIVMPDTNKGTGELIWVSPDGSVWWSRQTAFIVSCPFASGTNLNQLPFDTQSCTFKLGMYSQKASEVYIQWRGVAGVSAGPDCTPANGGFTNASDGVRCEKPALANWQGACLAEWHATKMSQESELQQYVSANYTYATAYLDFSRAPAVWLWSYFMPAVVMVNLSYLGFYIDPMATPARVALGMFTVLVVMTLFISLTSKLPPTVTLPWLAKFMLFSFFFNVVAMVEQVMVSFGSSIKKWLDLQTKELNAHTSWTKAMEMNKDKVSALFKEWDVNGDGKLSKKEFRRGIRIMKLQAPVAEVNAIFDAIDADYDGTIDISELEAWLTAVHSQIDERRQMTMKGSGRYSFQAAEEEFEDYEGVGAEPPDAAPANADPEKGGSSPMPPPRSCPAIAKKAAKIDPTPRMAEDAKMGASPTQLSTTNGTAPSAAPRKMSGKANKVLGVSQAIKQGYMESAKKDLDKGIVWKIKTFYLLPVLKYMMYLDFVFRVVFPICYLTFTLGMLAQVDFGASHYALLETAPCYRAALDMVEEVA